MSWVFILYYGHTAKTSYPTDWERERLTHGREGDEERKGNTTHPSEVTIAEKGIIGGIHFHIL